MVHVSMCDKILFEQIEFRTLRLFTEIPKKFVTHNPAKDYKLYMYLVMKFMAESGIKFEHNVQKFDKLIDQYRSRINEPEIKVKDLDNKKNS